ncbi:MAG: Yip1 family protein [Candidatus Bathycorpusculaceae bacterium]
MFAHDVLKVLYAPHKVFKEILQKPKLFGPLLIMILFAAAQTGFFYTVMSKSYVEQTVPKPEQLDAWTENATLWTGTAGLTIRDNFDDYINGTYYGNSSIEFSAINSNRLSMTLDNLESVNCYGPQGYKNLSLRMKLIEQQKPINVTIYLFSLSPSNYFYYDLTQEILSSTADAWNNITIPVGSDKWSSNGAAANWENITGLKLDFTWPSNATLTLRVDGLFFRGIFKRVTDMAGTSYIANFLMTAFTQFMLQWLILSGLIYIVSRAFGAKTAWTPIMVCIGFALMPMFIQALGNAATHSTLPNLYYPLELMGGVQGEFETAYEPILETTAVVTQIGAFLQGIVYVWTITLCTIATRALTEFKWVKSLLVSAASFLITIMILNFILGF